jgi:hypothetical protein
MEKTREECLLVNGVLRCDLGGKDLRVMKAMDDWAEYMVNANSRCNRTVTIEKAKKGEFNDFNFVVEDNGEIIYEGNFEECKAFMKGFYCK